MQFLSFTTAAGFIFKLIYRNYPCCFSIVFPQAENGNLEIRNDASFLDGDTSSNILPFSSVSSSSSASPSKSAKSQSSSKETNNKGASPDHKGPLHWISSALGSGWLKSLFFYLLTYQPFFNRV